MPWHLYFLLLLLSFQTSSENFPRTHTQATVKPESFSSLRTIPLTDRISQHAQSHSRRKLVVAPQNFVYMGGPVMTKGINLYVIFYGSTWSEASKSLITTFLQSLGPSGSTAQQPNLYQWWSILSEYYDESDNRISSNITYKGQYSVSKPVVTNLTLNSTTEALSIIADALSNKFPIDENGIYIILTGTDITVNLACTNVFFRGFLPYNLTTLKFAWAPDLSIDCPQKFYPFTTTALAANGDNSADGTIFMLAFLLPSIATDPLLSGWRDSRGYWVSAFCLFVYGETYLNPSTLGTYNIYGINNSTFLVSEMYSLSTQSCLLYPPARPPPLFSPPSPSLAPLAPLSPIQNPPGKGEGGGKGSVGIVAGAGAGAAVLLLVIIGVVVFCCCCYYCSKSKKDGKTPGPQPFGAPVAAGTVIEVGDGRFTRRFTLREVRAATDNFSDLQLLGKGGFGSVYSGNFSEGTWAVKRAHNRLSSTEVASFEVEVKLIARVSHRNLVGLKGFCNEGGEQILIYEFVSNGNLRQHIERNPRVGGQTLTLDQRITIAIDSAKGLEYLHGSEDSSIVHRDVKSENILLDERLTAKVADFGLLKEMDVLKSYATAEVVGTFGYMDPQYQSTKRVTTKSDVYSFGIIILELVTGKRPTFMVSNHAGDDQSYESLSSWVQKSLSRGGVAQVVDPSLGKNYQPGVIGKLLQVSQMCTRYEGRARPTMREVVALLEEARKELLGLQGVSTLSDGGSSASLPTLKTHDSYRQVDSELSSIGDSSVFHADVSFAPVGR